MLITLRARQLTGVALIVLLATALVGTVHLFSLVGVVLNDAEAHGQLLARAIFQRARDVVTDGRAAGDALRRDRALRTLLASSIAYGRGVSYATIVDTEGTILLHSFPGREGSGHVADAPLATVIAGGPIARLRAIYSEQTYAVEESLTLGETPFGAVRIGLSTVLLREELSDALRPAALATLVALALALVLAAGLSPWVLWPIHALRDGQDLAEPAGTDPEGTGAATVDTPSAESVRRLAALARPLAGVAHEVKNPLNAMTIHLELIRQKLAGLAGPTATVGGSSILGISEPTDADGTSAASADAAPRDDDLRSAREHLDVLEEEIKRLDEIIQGFVRFMRPPDLRLEPVAIDGLAHEVRALIAPEAERAGVAIEIDCPPALPALAADHALLQQAFLNLALNACQAMPSGGTLRIRARAAAGRRVHVTVEDTGEGIPPEQLERIFDLYYTSRADGSGLGLAMVHMAVQLHGGEIDVESTAGVGTRFRLALPQAYNIVT